MNRGVLMYAHNNQEIDYFKIACTNALMVQKNLQVPVSLVTDSGTFNWGVKTLTEEFIEQCFDIIIFVDKDYKFKNQKVFHDTSFNSHGLQFYNCDH